MSRKRNLIRAICFGRECLVPGCRRAAATGREGRGKNEGAGDGGRRQSVNKEGDNIEVGEKGMVEGDK